MNQDTKEYGQHLTKLLQGGDLKICTMYTEDDRYSVPTITFVQARSMDELREAAAQNLTTSPHHLRVEVWRDDDLLFKMDRAQATWSSAVARGYSMVNPTLRWT